MSEARNGLLSKPIYHCGLPDTTEIPCTIIHCSKCYEIAKEGAAAPEKMGHVTPGIRGPVYVEKLLPRRK